MAKLKLELDYEFDFALIGLSCHQPNYRLANCAVREPSGSPWADGRKSSYLRAGDGRPNFGAIAAVFTLCVCHHPA